MSHPAILPSTLPDVFAICPKCFHGRSYVGRSLTCENITETGFCGEPLKRLKRPIGEREFMRLTLEQRQDLKLAPKP